MRRTKGIAEVIAMAAIVAIGLVTWLAGPKLIGAVGDVFNGGNKNQAKQIHKVDIKYTMGYLDEKGKFVKVGDYSKREDMQNTIAEQPKEKWSTKVMVVIGLAIALAVAFPGVALKVILQAKKNALQIVAGIEDAKAKLPPESVAIIDTSLSKKMDTPAKKEVKKLKVKL